MNAYDATGSMTTTEGARCFIPVVLGPVLGRLRIIDYEEEDEEDEEDDGSCSLRNLDTLLQLAVLRDSKLVVVYTTPLGELNLRKHHFKIPFAYYRAGMSVMEKFVLERSESHEESEIERRVGRTAEEREVLDTGLHR